MFGHCRQPSGIAAESPTCAGITPAGNLTLAASSLRSSSSTIPAATTTAPITTAPTLYPRGHLLFVTHAAPASPPVRGACATLDSSSSRPAPPVAHAIVGPGYAHDAVWQAAARRSAARRSAAALSRTA